MVGRELALWLLPLPALPLRLWECPQQACHAHMCPAEQSHNSMSGLSVPLPIPTSRLLPQGHAIPLYNVHPRYTHNSPDFINVFICFIYYEPFCYNNE